MSYFTILGTDGYYWYMLEPQLTKGWTRELLGMEQTWPNEK